MPQNILITGASRGLGFHLAKGFLEKGNFVYSLNRSENSNIKILKTKFYGLFFSFKAETSDEKSIVKASKKIMGLVPHIDILINNAAVHLEPSPAEEGLPDIQSIDLDIVNKTFNINSAGPLRVVKHFIPLVLKGDGKLIVNISSEAGGIAGAWRKGEYGYCMSKAALNMASKILQNRFAADGVKVLAIHPGWIRTDMGTDAAPTPPEESAAKIIKLTERKWLPDDPVYMDTDGKKMNW
jgi:NAD(P)-dependent dehydrogenase (short-subunit alcohol dehydrogenase family)